MTTRFFGINNTTDPTALGSGWMTVAKNVDITDGGKIVTRAGYTLTRAGAFTGAFATRDRRRGFVATTTGIETIDGLSVVSDSYAGETLWAEMNGDVYYVRGASAGIIQADNEVLPLRWGIPEMNVLPESGLLEPGEYEVGIGYRFIDGRSTGVVYAIPVTSTGGVRVTGVVNGTEVYVRTKGSANFLLAGVSTSTADFVWAGGENDLQGEAVFQWMAALPASPMCITIHKGRLYSGHYQINSDTSYIWYSQPLAPHVFDLSSDFFAVPGQIRMLAPHEDELIVGTDRAIFSYSPNGLVTLANYGVPPGQHSTYDNKKLYFWSMRGVCTIPFQNLTERQVSVPPGSRAGGVLIERGGQKRYLVTAKTGGAAFNSR